MHLIPRKSGGVLGSTPMAIGARRGAKLKLSNLSDGFFCLYKNPSVHNKKNKK